MDAVVDRLMVGGRHLSGFTLASGGSRIAIFFPSSPNRMAWRTVSGSSSQGTSSENRSALERLYMTRPSQVSGLYLYASRTKQPPRRLRLGSGTSSSGCVILWIPKPPHVRQALSVLDAPLSTSSWMRPSPTSSVAAMAALMAFSTGILRTSLMVLPRTVTSSVSLPKRRQESFPGYQRQATSAAPFRRRAVLGRVSNGPLRSYSLRGGKRVRVQPRC